MPYNLPTGTTSNISYGPAVVFFGAVGSTPATDVGYIANDAGVNMTITRSTRTITAGNPKIPRIVFDQEQGCTVKFTGIEHRDQVHALGLGAGITASTVAQDTFSWGGDPAPTNYAMMIRHLMAGGNTLFIDLWTVVGSGQPAFNFTHDEHMFEFEFTALVTTTNWAGSSLSAVQQLFRKRRIK